MGIKNGEGYGEKWPLMASGMGVAAGDWDIDEVSVVSLHSVTAV